MGLRPKKRSKKESTKTEYDFYNDDEFKVDSNPKPTRRNKSKVPDRPKDHKHTPMDIDKEDISKLPSTPERDPHNSASQSPMSSHVHRATTRSTASNKPKRASVMYDQIPSMCLNDSGRLFCYICQKTYAKVHLADFVGHLHNHRTNMLCVFSEKERNAMRMNSFLNQLRVREFIEVTLHNPPKPESKKDTIPPIQFAPWPDARVQYDVFVEPQPEHRVSTRKATSIRTVNQFAKLIKTDKVIKSFSRSAPTSPQRNVAVIHEVKASSSEEEVVLKRKRPLHSPVASPMTSPIQTPKSARKRQTRQSTIIAIGKIEPESISSSSSWSSEELESSQSEWEIEMDEFDPVPLSRKKQKLSLGNLNLGIPVLDPSLKDHQQPLLIP